MILNLNLRLVSLLATVAVLSAMLLACSNDTDNLLAQVVDDSIEINVIIDDNYSIEPGAIQNLDVLENDIFPNVEKVILTKVTQPENGNVTLKEDNTIEYSAPDSASEISDTFTYTTESTDTAGKLTSNTGNVSILITEDTQSKTGTNDNYLFTLEAKAELKKRFENGYIAGSGFTNDISRALSDASTFLANPSEFRPVFGVENLIYPEGQILHTTALYAYAIDDITIANVVVEEILGTITSNNLATSFWTNTLASKMRWDGDQFNGWIQSAKAKKLLDSYNLLKNIQTVLKDSDKLTIESWFKEFAEMSYQNFKERVESYLGANWDINGVFKFVPEGIYPGEIENPIQDSSGNDITKFTMAWAQDIFNNRNWDVVQYIHSWAVEDDNREMENWAREYFKGWIKYATFADGTMAEMWRNSDNIPTSGIHYGWITSGAATEIAHLDATANHFPNDRLYDYQTTEGVLSGSVNLTTTGYAGSSTTNEVTKKSLLGVIKALTNYYRSSSNGGWNDLRYFKTSNNTLIQLNPTGISQPSVIAAMANLYYKDQDLVDFYMYNTSVGYPIKNSILSGYLASSVFCEDYGPWGNMIMGSAWFEQEANFFN
jgi:hypothetical protein